jgi:hypothetical protein
MKWHVNWTDCQDITGEYMQHLKILIACTKPQKEGVTLLKKLFAAAADTISLQRKELKGFVTIEDLTAKPSSNEINQRGDQYGYFVLVGKAVQDKLWKQIGGLGAYKVIHTPGLPMLQEGEIPEGFIGILDAWKNYVVEQEVDKAARVPEEDKPEWILKNLEDFRKFLVLEIHNGRYQACMWTWDEGGPPLIDVRDATKKLKTPVKSTVPILVKSAWLDEPGKQAEITEELKRNGYEDPLIVTTGTFIFLIEIYCRLSVEGIVHLRLHGERHEPWTDDNQARVRNAIQKYLDREEKRL